MKKIIALLMCAACTTASAQTAEELLNPGKNPENVLNFGLGYNLNMFSPLKEINKSNIKRLVPVWNFSLSNDMGELSQPTVYNGVMYVVNGNWTFAIDMETGRQIWRTPVNYDRGALRVTSGGAFMLRTGARHEDRQGNLENQIRRMEGKLRRRHRADHRQRRADFRHVGR